MEKGNKIARREPLINADGEKVGEMWIGADGLPGVPMTDPNQSIDPTALIEEFGAERLMDSVIPTRCVEGCEVEPDGECPHGAKSVLLLAGLI